MRCAFIVDDDYGAVLSIYNSINWRELNINVVEKITNPAGVAERIITEEPAVVFIDVEMGEISGLKIIEQVREAGKQTLFVIVSGHNDFAYAQTAIKYGVSYYLLKPVMPSSVDEVTERLMSEFRMRDFQSNDIDLNEILSDKKRLNSYLKGSGLVFPGQYRFLVAQFSGSGADNMIACLGDAAITHYKIGRNKILFLIRCAAYTNSMEIMLFNIVAVKGVAIGISDSFSCEEEIYDSFQLANVLSYGLFIMGEYGVFYNSPRADSCINQFMESLMEFLEQKKYSSFYNKLQTVPQYFRENRLHIRHALLIHNSIAFKSNIDYNHGNNSKPLPILNMEDLLVEYESLQNMCDELSDMVKGLVDNSASMENQQNQNGKIHFQNILNYIDENYSKKLTLSCLCEEFYISISYLCELFKQNLNKTFIEYLTDIRIDKAKELMKDKSLSTSKIAETIGYSDYVYFNKVFRKHSGCTPYEYRKQLNKED